MVISEGGRGARSNARRVQLVNNKSYSTETEFN